MLDITSNLEPDIGHESFMSDLTMRDDERASHSGLILNSAYFGQVSLVLSDEGRHWKLTASRLLMSGS